MTIILVYHQKDSKSMIKKEYKPNNHIIKDLNGIKHVFYTPIINKSMIN